MSVESCETRVDSVGALGTWVGGLATAAGLVFAAMELRSNRLASSAQRERERRSLRLQARQVRLSVNPFTKAAGYLSKFTVTVHNKSAGFVTDLGLLIDGEVVDKTIEQVHPGQSWTWTIDADLAKVVIPAPHKPGKAADDPDLKREVKKHALPRVQITYTIDIADFKRDHRTVILLPEVR